MTEKKDTNRARLERVENAMITLNREMGVVQGELKWIKWLMGASTAVLFSQLIINVLHHI